ncbi:MAG: hypothetical protein BGO77_02685 [Caedibacter sp. 37-49]|nr:MAG: hypothetical protein BGO77_02685 [Caedibacter sp. 37-49]
MIKIFNLLSVVVCFLSFSDNSKASHNFVENQDGKPQSLVKFNPTFRWMIKAFNESSPFGDSIDKNDLLSYGIGAEDTRKEVKVTTSIPYKDVGLLDFKDPQGVSYIGTGALVSEKHVLTAAHNCIVCLKGIPVPMREMKFYRGFSRSAFIEEGTVKRCIYLKTIAARSLQEMILLSLS